MLKGGLKISVDLITSAHKQDSPSPPQQHVVTLILGLEDTASKVFAMFFYSIANLLTFFLFFFIDSAVNGWPVLQKRETLSLNSEPEPMQAQVESPSPLTYTASLIKALEIARSQDYQAAAMLELTEDLQQEVLLGESRILDLIEALSDIERDQLMVEAQNNPTKKVHRFIINYLANS